MKTKRHHFSSKLSDEMFMQLKYPFGIARQDLDLMIGEKVSGDALRLLLRIYRSKGMRSGRI